MCTNAGSKTCQEDNHYDSADAADAADATIALWKKGIMPGLTITLASQKRYFIYLCLFASMATTHTVLVYASGDLSWLLLLSSEENGNFL